MRMGTNYPKISGKRKPKVNEYTIGDTSCGDLDGDGQYEIVMLWSPSDAKDAATGGRTGKVIWMLTNLTVLSLEN